MQLLLAGANSGQLSHKDVYVFQKSYAACLDYSTVEVLSSAFRPSGPCVQNLVANALNLQQSTCDNG
jgi:hypothetical protein